MSVHQPFDVGWLEVEVHRKFPDAQGSSATCPLESRVSAPASCKGWSNLSSRAGFEPAISTLRGWSAGVQQRL
jgi:hypothetical protein